MKTFAFIGSDKDAGKTTALNFIYRRLRDKLKSAEAICLTATGVSGKRWAVLTEATKPAIDLAPGTYFVTHFRHLDAHNGAYAILKTFSPPDFAEPYLLGRALKQCRIVLEGPNRKTEISLLKTFLANILPQGYLLIDGAADRQFLGHPAICDAFYFAVLQSNRAFQRQKTLNLLTPLAFPQCTVEVRDIIAGCADDTTKSLLFMQKAGPRFDLIYHGREIPAVDTALRYWCQDPCKFRRLLYLNGALTGELLDVVGASNQLVLVLDNFTLFQATASDRYAGGAPAKLQLLHRVPVKLIFMKTEDNRTAFQMPAGIPAVNLFRDNPDEIGIYAGHYS